MPSSRVPRCHRLMSSMIRQRGQWHRGRNYGQGRSLFNIIHPLNHSLTVLVLRLCYLIHRLLIPADVRLHVCLTISPNQAAPSPSLHLPSITRQHSTKTRKKCRHLQVHHQEPVLQIQVPSSSGRQASQTVTTSVRRCSSPVRPARGATPTGVPACVRLSQTPPSSCWIRRTQRGMAHGERIGLTRDGPLRSTGRWA